MDKNTKAMRLLVAWLSGDSAAETELIAWCGAFVTRWQSGGMTDDDTNEIVDEAWADFLEIAQYLPATRTEHLYQELTRALWRAKKRWQREQDLRLKTEELSDFSATAGSENPEDVTITSQLLQLVVNKIFMAFESELPRLSERDHDLISRLYRLEDDFPPTAPSIHFSAPSAARQAESRARRRLAKAVDEWLERALEANPRDRLVIELAEEVVRGNRVLNVVDLMEEFESKVAA